MICCVHFPALNVYYIEIIHQNTTPQYIRKAFFENVQVIKHLMTTIFRLVHSCEATHARSQCAQGENESFIRKDSTDTTKGIP